MFINWKFKYKEKKTKKPIVSDKNYELRQFREVKDGVETGKIIESKLKKENGETIKETKTTILNADGTSDVTEIREDKTGKHEKKIKLDKENRPMLTELWYNLIIMNCY